MRQHRAPAVAGLFYPEDPQELRRVVNTMLDVPQTIAPPKAIIAPHAGYQYSGSIAGTVYAQLAPLRKQITRVVLLGPAHRVGFEGIAVSNADAFDTPLGDIPLDKQAIAQLLLLPQVHVFEAAHRQEHSLEVHLPFLQTTLDKFSLIPLVVGEVSADDVADVIDALWGGDETLVVVSSDLSHFHDYHDARVIDAETTRAIEHLEPQSIGFENACGRNPVNGLLIVAKRRGLTVQTLDLRNSGDTAGPRDRVVGYGAYAFH